MTVQTVHFDRPFHDLEEADAQAWRAWLVQHQLDHLSIAWPSQLVYRRATKRKTASVTIELLNRDTSGAFRTKRTINFSGPLVPFPLAIGSRK